MVTWKVWRDTMTVKKRKPQDSTLRNVRAANTRIAALEVRMRVMDRRLQYIERVSKKFLDIYGYK